MVIQTQKSFIPLGGILTTLLSTPTFSASVEMIPFNFIPYALSGDGRTVVGHDAATGQAARWTSAGGLVDLGTLPGGIANLDSAHGVSTDGSVIVGGADVYPGTGADVHRAFRWTQAEGMVDLGVLPTNGTSYSAANGVSGDGTVIVGKTTHGDGSDAFRWTQATGMVSLGNNSLEATGVSADGSVVAGITDGYAIGSNGGFQWTESAGYSLLPSGFRPSNYEASDSALGSSFGDAISSDGSKIVGCVNCFTGALDPMSAASWSASGGVSTITLGGSVPVGDAISASADGQVVVGWSRNLLGQDEAFLWDTTHGTRRLVDVLSSQGLDMTDWYIANAIGVSDDGRTILFGALAWSLSSENGGGGFGLVHLDATPVPIPAAFWLFGSSLVGFVGLRRRLSNS